VEASAYVDSALRQIRMDLSLGLARIQSTCAKRLDSAANLSNTEGLEEELRAIWTEMVDEFSVLIAKHFEALVDIAANNPELGTDHPVGWAEKFVCSDKLEFFKYTTANGGFLYHFYSLLPQDDSYHDSYQSLETDLWIELDLAIGDAMAPAVKKLARQGWRWKPSESGSQASECAKAMQLPETLQFTLADLEEAPSGTPRNDVVRYLYRPISDSIKAIRSWQDEEGLHQRQVTAIDIARRFPIFKAARARELKIVLDRQFSPQQSSVDIMSARANLGEETIRRYLRRMRSRKSI